MKKGEKILFGMLNYYYYFFLSGEKEPNGPRYRIRYKTLREASAHQLEGLSLLLKTMKSNGIVSYDGVVVVDDNAVITLLGDK